MTQIATLHLTAKPEVTPTGKAFIVNFKTPTGRTTVYVPVSQSRFDLGVLWIADWLVGKKQEGIGRVLDLGFTPIDGKVIPAEVKAPQVPTIEAVEPIIHKGTFTVESTHGEEKHRTFQILTTQSGKTKIGLMAGSNNEKDYIWFGYVIGNEIRFWHKANFRYGIDATLPISRELVNELFAVIIGDPNEAGLRFARESKRCMRCRRKLTTPVSLDLGIGPECAGWRLG